MRYVNMHDAKTNFSKYVDLVVAKHEIIIMCRNGKPLAQLVEFKEKKVESNLVC